MLQFGIYLNVVCHLQPKITFTTKRENFSQHFPTFQSLLHFPWPVGTLLIAVICNTPVLLQMKKWTVLYMKRFYMSTRTKVTNFEKKVHFWPTMYLTVWHTKVDKRKLVKYNIWLHYMFY